MSDEYKYGKPNRWGDFPYLYCGQYTEDELNDILVERLPDNYNMQIVDPVEEQVLSDLSTIGIDSHLEAMTMNKKDKIVDRKIGDKVFCRHHELDFSKSGMICLIRRLAEYNPSDYDHSDFDCGDRTDYVWDSDIEDRGSEPYDFWMAAYNLRSCILETLQIEGSI